MDASAPLISPPLSITLQLPVPPSVNRTRKIDYAGLRALRNFYLRSDLQLTAAYGPRPAPVRVITGPYEIRIQIPDFSRIDLDNHCKVLLDYLVSREFVADDHKRYLRRLTIEWGSPDQHVHVTITETGDG